MTTMKFGSDAARRLEHAYMTPDVVKQREATLALFGAKPGEHIVDIGSGPGFLCESIAQQVGPNGVADQSVSCTSALISPQLARMFVSFDLPDMLCIERFPV